ncbi:hypothetical protein PIB30_044959 [Stylosanthes scabra]|uniref:Uncharacterized protein n=1 Tax=Stylosanthes scabra TaxID=79078 RepID=A0ABU6TFP8_9FABA|nr:hypothetical protein [Stylosanthes scabra]
MTPVALRVRKRENAIIADVLVTEGRVAQTMGKKGRLREAAVDQRKGERRLVKANGMENNKKRAADAPEESLSLKGGNFAGQKHGYATAPGTFADDGKERVNKMVLRKKKHAAEPLQKARPNQFGAKMEPL